MKKLRYSIGLKATVVVIQQILFVILITSILLVATLFQKNILNFEDIRNDSFLTSAYFNSLFRGSVEDVLNYVELRRKFETDGSYNTEKTIDISRYYTSQGKIEEPVLNKGQVDGENRYYYLGDLVEWARDYTMSGYEITSAYYVEDKIVQKQTVTCNGQQIFSQEKVIENLADMSTKLQEAIISDIEYYYGSAYDISYRKIGGSYVESNSNRWQQDEEADGRERTWDEVLQSVINGDLYELNGDELNLLLLHMNMRQKECKSTYSFVNEEYLSIDGRGIWDDFIQGNCTEEQMQSAYAELEYTLNNIGQEVNNYKKCLNRYNQTKDGSNVYYWVKKGSDGKVYTNIEGGTPANLIDYGKEKGKYFYFRESDMRLASNVEGMVDIFYDELEQKYGEKDNILFMCVDTSFVQKDTFYEAQQEYGHMYPWVYIGLISMVVSALGCLICFIYLSTVAGKKGTEEEPVICWFDKIPTEILFIAASVFTIMIVLMSGEVYYRLDSSQFAGILIVSDGIAFVAIAGLMLFYLSFVRKIRAGVLWSTSITHWIVRGTGAVFQMRRPATKMIIWFGIHLLGCILLAPLTIRLEEDWQLIGIGCFILLSIVEGAMIIREGVQRNKVLEGIRNISSGDLEFKIDTKELRGDNKKLAEEVNTIGEGLFHAVDASMKNERLKADLITNVSHDIRTPLTSIINYVDLLKREDIPGERAQNYLKVLEQKSQRLKQLTEDLLEASKISSGNITLQMERINLVELVYQTGGEFDEKFEEKGLSVVANLPKEPVVIMADGRRIWRVIENLYNNVAKYAMPNTRVYVDMKTEEDKVTFSIKNISQNALNIQADELTERFIRGDVSRSTEGSGLGLSIAQNLTTLMGGEFEIYLDGDLFRVTLGFKREIDTKTEEDYNKSVLI